MKISAVFGEKQLPVQNSYLEYSPSGPLTDAVKVINVSLDLSGVSATTEIPLNILNPKIFGVCWDYSNSSTVLTRLTRDTDPNKFVTIDINTEPIPANETSEGSSPFDNYMPWSGMEEYNIIDGEISYKQGEIGFSRTAYDTFVKIPEFWYRIIDDPQNNKRYWYVSDIPARSFQRHPGSGKYIARYFTSNKITSVSGSTLDSGNLAHRRETTAAKGSKFHLLDLPGLAAIQILYLVEFADFNSQQKIKLGTTIESAPGKTDNMIYHTGFSQNYLQYRHIEGIFSVFWQMIDGVICDGQTIYLSDNPSQYSSERNDSYKLITSELAPKSGFIKNLAFLEDFPFTFIPSLASGGSTITYVPDMYYSNGGVNYILIIGGGPRDGDNAGLFSFNVSVQTTFAAGNVQSRMIYDPNIILN